MVFLLIFCCGMWNEVRWDIVMCFIGVNFFVPPHPVSFLTKKYIPFFAIFCLIFFLAGFF